MRLYFLCFSINKKLYKSVVWKGEEDVNRPKEEDVDRPKEEDVDMPKET